ncbi:MAG: 50S ribosomal protein L24 [Neisseriaceae bacterium]|nr:MAG: 50S ribosomal protein L24 [Neisseriaceae bacterium]
MRKIRKGDEIIVIAGKDKGKIAQVSAVVAEGQKVVVDGVNVVKKHVRPNPMKNVQGGIESITKPIDVSNVAIYNTETKKADRIGFKVENGEKVRFFKSTGKLVG